MNSPTSDFSTPRTWLRSPEILVCGRCTTTQEIIMAGSGSREFDVLKRHLETTPSVKREVEFAFSALLTAANPSDRGLRFLFGNGAEWIIAAAAWSSGVLVAPQGHNTNGFDLGDLL